MGGHVLRVSDRDAEGERALLRPLPPLCEHVFGALLRCQATRQFVDVEAPISPGDLAVIDGGVEDAVVVERRQQLGSDALEERAGEDQVTVAQRQDVRLVSAVRGRRQAEQEGRREVSQQTAVGSRCGMMELVDDDVVEVLG